jgi:hypothetical protein
MRNKLTIGVAVLAAFALGALGFGTTLAAQPGKGGGNKTIQLTSTEIKSSLLDLGEGAPPAQGDQIVFASRLASHGTTVGEDGGSCTFTHVVSATVITTNCIDTLVLPRGQITVQGLVTFDEQRANEPFTVAITGGTGAYTGVSGEMDVQSASDTVDNLTLRLKR